MGGFQLSQIMGLLDLYFNVVVVMKFLCNLIQIRPGHTGILIRIETFLWLVVLSKSYHFENMVHLARGSKM